MYQRSSRQTMRRQPLPGVGQRSGRGQSVMPSVPSSSQTVRRSGQTRPVSIRPMVATDTPDASASSCWLSCGPERTPLIAIAMAATCSTARRSAGLISDRQGPVGQRPFGDTRSRGTDAGTDPTLTRRFSLESPQTWQSVTGDRSSVRCDAQGGCLDAPTHALPQQSYTVSSVNENEQTTGRRV